MSSAAQKAPENFQNKLSMRKPIGEVLVELGLIQAADLQGYLEKCASQKLRLGEFLVKESIINDMDLAKALSQQFGIEYSPLDAYQPSLPALKLLSEKIAKSKSILPLEIRDGTLVLAVYDPLVTSQLEGPLKLMKMPYTICVTSQTALAKAMEKAYASNSTIQSMVQSLSKEDPKKKAVSLVQAATKQKEQDDSPSIENLVAKIIDRAIQHHASDIHIDPSETIVRIRNRVDGILHIVETYPLDLHSNVISRLKVLARMDIAEKRVPQDGRFPYESGSKSVDIRISTLPTIRGEKAVMRIIDKSAVKDSFDALGMGTATKESIKKLLDCPHGLIFVTGPTGSGKTTTLYTMLMHINDAEKNIVTVEDPVEYQFDLINQVQVHGKAGLTFAGVLKNILRQDPDVIMIGEVRDQETADIAVQAALTGHLVLSTLHTNDAVSTPTRLVDIGIEPFLLSSALVGVISQRLVRVLCPHCKEKRPIKEEEALLLGKGLIPPGSEICAPKGCANCYNTGYLGRISVFELLIPNRDIQRDIAERKHESDILAHAEAIGFKTMRQDGIEKVLAGITSVEEIVKATM